MAATAATKEGTNNNCLLFFVRLSRLGKWESKGGMRREFKLHNKYMYNVF
jgi:hypothetical protein